MQVRWHHSLEDLAPWRDAWNALAGDAPFRGWTWLSTWWRHYGSDGGHCSPTERRHRRQLRVALVLNDSGNSGAANLLGILPCYIAPTLAHGRVLRLLGDGEVCSDHLGVLTHGAHAEGVADALAEFLTTDGSWDLADFTAVDESDAATTRLFAALAERGCDVAIYPDQNTWAIDLPTDWDEFLALQSKSHRKQLRQAERRVLDHSDAAWRLVQDPAEFDAAWTTLTDLHQRRRQCLGEPGCFSWPAWAAFHRDVARQLLDEGRLRLSTLEIAGTAVAAEYHVAGSHATYAYQGGVDPTRLAEEPGRLSTIRALQHAMAEGHARFDFLRGDEPYKAHWLRRAARHLAAAGHGAATLAETAPADVGGRPPRRSTRSAAHGNVWLRQRRDPRFSPLMLSDTYRDPLVGMYYLATLPQRRWAAARAAAAGQAPVIALYYHRIADEHPNDWTMSRDRFRAQVEWIRERYEIVSLMDAQRRIASRSNHTASVCLTFDDGYADNCEFAVPWLLEQQLPFTYFISTHHVLEGRPFAHDVERNCPLAPNTPQQVAEMAAAGVEIGAHTRRHADLGPLVDDEQIHEEIVGSKRDLEELIDRAIRYFAFPYGMKANLSQAAFRMAFQAGFWAVCSAYGGYNYPGDDAFHIHRLHADPKWSRFCNWMTADPQRRRGVKRFDPGDYRIDF